uniref:Uncharacterized protein n=1 Tax=Anguilla anguilla TaxID=7936 RepID=A0A0E9PW82_ANGAN
MASRAPCVVLSIGNVSCQYKTTQVFTIHLKSLHQWIVNQYTKSLELLFN